MAYGRAIRERAFQLYCVETTLDGVVEKLQKEYSTAGEINRKTLSRWRDEDGWDERRSGVLAEGRQKSDVQLAEELGEIGGNLKRVIERLYESLESLPPRSFEGAASALPTVLKLYLKLIGAEGGSVDLNPRQLRAVMGKIRRAMFTVPELRDAMSEEVQAKLGAAVEAEFAG